MTLLSLVENISIFLVALFFITLISRKETKEKISQTSNIILVPLSVYYTIFLFFLIFGCGNYSKENYNDILKYLGFGYLLYWFFILIVFSCVMGIINIRKHLFYFIFILTMITTIYYLKWI